MEAAKNKRERIDKLSMKLHFTCKLLAGDKYQNNALWIRAGLDRPALLEAPQRTRGRLLRQKRLLLTRQRGYNAQSALRGNFRRLFIRNVAVKTPKVTHQPPPEVLQRFQEMYNAAPSPSAAALVIQESAILKAGIALSNNGAILPLLPFRFTEGMLEDAIAYLGKQKSAPGVSGVTYGGLATALSSLPPLIPTLCEELNSLVDHLAKDAGGLPAPAVVWPLSVAAVRVSLIPRGDPSSVDIRRWRPISNAESVCKLALEALRVSLVGRVGIPLDRAPSGLAPRFHSWFCAEGVVPEGVVGRG